MRNAPSVCLAFALLQLVLTSFASFSGKMMTPALQRGAFSCEPRDTLGSLMSELPPVLHNGYKSEDNIFPYYDSAISQRYDRFLPEFEMADINTSLLLDGADPSHFYYYSGNLMQDQFSFLRTKTNIAKHVHSLVSDTAIRKKLTANIWIGKAGVQATAHYDSVHNIYIHLAGIKIIRLLPPSAVQYLQVHGRMHPYACQSRYKHLSTGELFNRTFCVVSETCTPTSRTEILSTEHLYSEYIAQYNRDIIEIVLTPGDVLYIPPFWFHEVVAQTAALSVSLWWDAVQLDVMDIVYALPLPLESDWDADLTIKAARIYLSEICEAVETILQDIPNNITIPALTSLIKYRYYEDWQHQYIMRFGNRATVDRSVEENLLAKLHSAAQRVASTFVTGFRSEENFASENMLKELRKPHRFDRDCGYASAEQCIISNQMAILQIKLMDYIEDVFLQVSELVLAQRCELDVSTSICVIYSGYQPVELAVKLLLDWVSASSV